MLISDWSSDVCSSDLPPAARLRGRARQLGLQRRPVARGEQGGVGAGQWLLLHAGTEADPRQRPAQPVPVAGAGAERGGPGCLAGGVGDRRSVATGTSVSLGVKLGVLRTRKNKTKHKKHLIKI